MAVAAEPGPFAVKDTGAPIAETSEQPSSPRRSRQSADGGTGAAVRRPG